MAHAMSFSSPSSFACNTVVLGMRWSLRDMAWLSECCWGVCPAITEQHLSCCEILFCCFISKPAQALWLFYKAGIYYTCLLQTVLSICLQVSCTWLDPQGAPFAWVIAIFVGISLSSSFSLVIKSTRGFARGTWQGSNGDFLPLQPKNTCNFYHPSEVAWVGWMLIIGIQEDLLLSPWDVTNAVSHCGYTNCMPLPSRVVHWKMSACLGNQFYWCLFYCSFPYLVVNSALNAVFYTVQECANHLDQKPDILQKHGCCILPCFYWACSGCCFLSFITA